MGFQGPDAPGDPAENRDYAGEAAPGYHTAKHRLNMVPVNPTAPHRGIELTRAYTAAA